MEHADSRNQNTTGHAGWRMPFFVIPVAFFLVEVYGFVFLQGQTVSSWPLAFGALWAIILTAFSRLLPTLAGRILFGISYFLSVGYTAAQTGYYLLFRDMMWISDFRYASEGSEFFSVLLQYPASWYLFLLGLIGLGVLLVWKFPARRWKIGPRVISVAAAALAIFCLFALPKTIFLRDRQIQYAGSDYGRAQSAEAAYTNMFNVQRLYEICGVYQTAAKDIYANYIHPLLPSYAIEQANAIKEIDTYFQSRPQSGANSMTGIFEGKNVVFVLMESMDDWALGEHTPTINRMMEEGIVFTDFYTPVYGSVRTFNSEFCGNTGSYLSSQGGYAFDYVTNDYKQSLANQLRGQGYTAKVYHYNDPSFYSRGVFSPAMGYEEYVCYADYVTEENADDLYDDNFLFNNPEVAEDFFRDGPTLNFVITRSAHLSYVYNEVLSYWGLKKYPQYRGLTGHQEMDCMYLKARLVDDMFTRLLEELQTRGELENTVIVAYTDHYSYGVKDIDMMMEASGVDDLLLLEKTPCFIWSANGPHLTVEKTLNTADLLPTVLNLMGVKSKFSYIGQDAFDPNYEGYALFPDGSWVSNGIAYSAESEQILIQQAGKVPDDQLLEAMAQKVNQFVYINNLILETNYYHQK